MAQLLQLLALDSYHHRKLANKKRELLALCLCELSGHETPLARFSVLSIYTFMMAALLSTDAGAVPRCDKCMHHHMAVGFVAAHVFVLARKQRNHSPVLTAVVGESAYAIPMSSVCRKTNASNAGTLAVSSYFPDLK